MRRLTADAEGLRTEFAGHPNIFTVPVGYEPSDAYRITFNVPGISLDANGQPITIQFHQVLVQLVAGYPREKPVATMETRIFHPNFGPKIGDEICIGDYWSPAQSLPDIVVTIGELIQYQRYN
jgi:ubiquitin-protein ligase